MMTTTATTIEIKGTSYIATVREADVILEREDGTVYSVSMENGRAVCTCPDWTYRHSKLEGTVCKHGRAVLDLGLIG